MEEKENLETSSVETEDTLTARLVQNGFSQETARTFAKALIDDGWTDLSLFSAITDSDFERLAIRRGGDRARVRRLGTSETETLKRTIDDTGTGIQRKKPKAFHCPDGVGNQFDLSMVALILQLFQRAFMLIEQPLSPIARMLAVSLYSSVHVVLESHCSYQLWHITTISDTKITFNPSLDTSL
eukprot:TRINITY_DN3376_c0_g1_i1.p1 TRINITY_DN3376_c0_g1~~TRINITY_DN3376_c0_g1_i1.p1  ORF type:complete len:213 (-),score=28.00 TRINITY_DN3376_c0_g1_i1:1391-1942(-)